MIVVDEPELKNKVADATSARALGMNHFTKQAPVHILLVEEKVNLTSGIGGWVKQKDYAQMDLGVVAAHIVLAAHAEGLGSCIVGWFNEPRMRELLSIPDSKRVWLDIVIGYSTQSIRPKKRKANSEIISYNKYNLRNFNLFNTKFLFFCWLHRKKISSLYPEMNYETSDQPLVYYNDNDKE